MERAGRDRSTGDLDKLIRNGRGDRQVPRTRSSTSVLDGVYVPGLPVVVALPIQARLDAVTLSLDDAPA